MEGGSGDGGRGAVLLQQTHVFPVPALFTDLWCTVVQLACELIACSARGAERGGDQDMHQAQARGRHVGDVEQAGGPGVEPGP